MSGHYDVLWKGMVEEVCDDLLRFVFPDAEKELDLTRGFEFLDKELSELYPEPEGATSTRVVDKLVKVFLRDGTERWMLLHLEIQGGRDPEFAKRMFTYYYRIMDRYNHPVTAVAIFTAEDGKKMPVRHEGHFMGTHLTYEYNALCITDYKDEDLKASDNPFAVVVLAARVRLHLLKNAKTEDQWDRELLEHKLLVVKLLQEKKIFGEQKIGVIMSFLNNYIQFKKPETNIIFMNRTDQITGKQNTMGYFEQLAQIKEQEGLEKGRHEGRHEGQIQQQESTVRNLLTSTDFSADKIASLVGVSEAFVERVKNGHN